MNAADLAARVIAMYQHQGDFSAFSDDDLCAVFDLLQREMDNRALVPTTGIQVRLIDYRTALDRAYKESGIEP